MAHTAFMRAAGAALLLSTAGVAQASTLVIGGGAAQECSDAAQKGRSDAKSVLACTTALEVETLNFRDRARTFVNRGVLQLRQRQFSAARSDFDAAGDIDPNLGEVYVNRGASYVGEERYREGVEQIDKGLAMGVKDPEKAWFNRGLANEGLGDLNSAYRDYSRAATLKPDWGPPKTELARFTVKRP